MKLIYFLIIIIVILLIYGFLENFRFVITKYEIKSPKIPENLNTKKCIVISDLHNCEFGKNNIKLLKKIDEINPNFILIAGDSVNGTKHCDKAIHFLKELSNRYTVIAANGNHELEQQLFYPDWYDEYNKTGIINLDNSKKQLMDNCNVYGLNININFYKRFLRPAFTSEELTAKLGFCENECYNILVAHNPAYIKEYIEHGFDLVVCGHWHGGIVRIPFIGGVITPQFKIFPDYSGGQFHFGHQDVIVSRGLGSHTIKLRINNTPELIILDFNKTGD